MATQINLYSNLGGTPDTNGNWGLVSMDPATSQLNVIGVGGTTTINPTSGGLPDPIGFQNGTDWNVDVDFVNAEYGTYVFRYTVGCDDVTADLTVEYTEVGVNITHSSKPECCYELTLSNEGVTINNDVYYHTGTYDWNLAITSGSSCDQSADSGSGSVTNTITGILRRQKQATGLTTGGFVNTIRVTARTSASNLSHTLDIDLSGIPLGGTSQVDADTFADDILTEIESQLSSWNIPDGGGTGSVNYYYVLIM